MVLGYRLKWNELCRTVFKYLKLSNDGQTLWHTLHQSVRIYLLDVSFIFFWLHCTNGTLLGTKWFCPKYNFHKLYSEQNCGDFLRKMWNYKTNNTKPLLFTNTNFMISSCYYIFYEDHKVHSWIWAGSTVLWKTEPLPELLSYSHTSW